MMRIMTSSNNPAPAAIPIIAGTLNWVLLLESLFPDDDGEVSDADGDGEWCVGGDNLLAGGGGEKTWPGELDGGGGLRGLSLLPPDGGSGDRGGGVPEFWFDGGGGDDGVGEGGGDEGGGEDGVGEGGGGEGGGEDGVGEGGGGGGDEDGGDDVGDDDSSDDSEGDGGESDCDDIEDLFQSISI